jgi:dTDP-4-amino-4,6-dideoxygalactose transaminase
MPDILAAFGAAQLERYDEMLEVRRELVDIYDNAFKGTVVKPLIHRSQQYNGSHHAYIVSIDGLDAKKRNHLIVKMEKRGVSLNVHFKPLPLHTAYINLGFDIGDYPNALAYYNSTVSLPLYSAMTKEIVMYVVEQLLDELKSSDCKESDHAGC